MLVAEIVEEKMPSTTGCDAMVVIKVVMVVVSGDGDGDIGSGQSSSGVVWMQLPGLTQQLTSSSCSV